MKTLISAALLCPALACAQATPPEPQMDLPRATQGKVHELQFSRGIVQNPLLEKVDGVEVSPMRITGDTDQRGTEVRFLPDTDIFRENHTFQYDILAKRLRELSFLNNGVRIRLIDERTGKEDDFAGSGGVKGFVAFINGARRVLHPTTFYASGSRPAESYGGSVDRKSVV